MVVVICLFAVVISMLPGKTSKGIGYDTPIYSLAEYEAQMKQ